MDTSTETNDSVYEDMSTHDTDTDTKQLEESDAGVRTDDHNSSNELIDQKEHPETEISQRESQPLNDISSDMEASTQRDKHNYHDTNTDTESSDELPSRTSLWSYFESEPINFVPAEFPRCKNSLLSYNLTRLESVFQHKSEQDKKCISDGTSSTISLFNQLKTSLMVNDSTSGIDWEEWSKLVNNQLSYDQTNDLIANGIPDDIRAIIWQIISKSNNPRLNDHYLIKKSNNSIHERQIKKDITRNSFYNSISQYNKIVDVFNNLKVYSELHPEIGYNQSFIFILSPVILKLPELESFNLFHTLLEDYNAKALFDKEMSGLQVILYKFDRLLEHHCPLLFNHLINQGIKSNMYASQWFLTFFSYKFPLEIILRIYDHVIFEGIDYLLKVSIKLMTINQKILLGLKFDELLGFLNNKIFDVLIEQAGAGVKYNLSGLFNGLIDINPNLLRKFELEFERQTQINKDKKEEITRLNLSNGKLRNEIKYLQMSLANLNKDHLNLVQTLINLKIKLPELSQLNSDLTKEIDGLKGNLNDMKEYNDVDIPGNIETQIEELLVENKAATERNMALEDELDELGEKDRELGEKLRGLKKGWFWS